VSLHRSANHIVPDLLFDAIHRRQSTRSLYNGSGVPTPELRRVEAVCGSDKVFGLMFTGTSAKEAIIEYVKEGDRLQYQNGAFVEELVHWLRFDKREAMSSRDGLYTICSGKPQLPRWLGQHFVTTGSGNGQALSDQSAIRSSSGLVVIVSDRDDKAHWVAVGRLYERLALTLTTGGIKTAFVNQPIEVPELRSQFQDWLGVGSAFPQLIFRFGYAEAMPQSLRRPVADVLI
jgi:hypothetical protein